jgi:hypothetical protein
LLETIIKSHKHTHTHIRARTRHDKCMVAVINTEMHYKQCKLFETDKTMLLLNHTYNVPAFWYMASRIQENPHAVSETDNQLGIELVLI